MRTVQGWVGAAKVGVAERRIAMSAHRGLQRGMDLFLETSRQRSLRARSKLRLRISSLPDVVGADVGQIGGSVSVRQMTGVNELR